MSGWRPMEELPELGPNCLGGKQRFDLWVVRHSSSGKPFSQYRAPDCHFDGKRWHSRWVDASGETAIPTYYEPKFWRPIPEAPDL